MLEHLDRCGIGGIVAEASVGIDHHGRSVRTDLVVRGHHEIVVHIRVVREHSRCRQMCLDLRLGQNGAVDRDLGDVSVELLAGLTTVVETSVLLVADKEASRSGKCCRRKGQGLTQITIEEYLGFAGRAVEGNCDVSPFPIEEFSLRNGGILSSPVEEEPQGTALEERDDLVALTTGSLVGEQGPLCIVRRIRTEPGFQGQSGTREVVAEVHVHGILDIGSIVEVGSDSAGQGRNIRDFRHRVLVLTVACRTDTARTSRTVDRRRIVRLVGIGQSPVNHRIIGKNVFCIGVPGCCSCSRNHENLVLVGDRGLRVVVIPHDRKVIASANLDREIRLTDFHTARNPVDHEVVEAVDEVAISTGIIREGEAEGDGIGFRELEEIRPQGKSPRSGTCIPLGHEGIGSMQRGERRSVDTGCPDQGAEFSSSARSVGVVIEAQ